MACTVYPAPNGPRLHKGFSPHCLTFRRRLADPHGEPPTSGGSKLANALPRSRQIATARPITIHHMNEDSLVGWAWAPGAGRTPAPGTQALFGGLVKAWAASGAFCP
jgi:hypothetical protein